jgi:hypothetical protein
MLPQKAVQIVVGLVFAHFASLDPGSRQSFAMIPWRVFSGSGPPPVCVLHCRSLVANSSG